MLHDTEYHSIQAVYPKNIHISETIDDNPSIQAKASGQSLSR